MVMFPVELIIPLTVFMKMPFILIAVTPPGGTTPVTVILPPCVSILPPLKVIPLFEVAEVDDVPARITSPPVVVRLPPAFNEIPGFVVAFAPLAVKFIAMKPVGALALVIAASIEINASAVRVSVVAADQGFAEASTVMGLLTVIDPTFAHPAPPVALVEMVTDPRLRFATRVCALIVAGDGEHPLNV
jgi:hypothetical protein